MFHKLKESFVTSRLIRNAIDSYPDGICFATLSGRPVLANRMINEICADIIGHTIINAETVWDELSQIAIRDDILDNNSPRLEDDEGGGRLQRLICRRRDGSIWQFKRQIITAGNEGAIQYEASDITELYQYQKRLAENNIRAEQLHERQRELLKNIVRNNLDKELLSAKIRIHDQFGRCLIMTKNALTGSEETFDERKLFSEWENVIADMENAAEDRNTTFISPEKELVQVADMIGCRVMFEGKQPAERKALLLLYAAIREALTNAVRHAGADRITVRIQEDQGEYHVEISDNGRTNVSEVREGGGLSTVRSRFEREGASFEIRCDKGVVLSLVIPKE